MSEERVAIFIDGSNFYNGLKEVFGKAKIDFSKFAGFLCGDRKLIRIYYYNSPLIRQGNETQYADQQRFFAVLDRIPYLTQRHGKLGIKEITCIYCKKTFSKSIQKGVDSFLVTDLLKMAFNDLYDTAILVSGDDDFACAVEAVKEKGKHVEMAFFELKARGYQLFQTCDKFVCLTKDNLTPFFFG